jgi:hypothetical protein
MNQQDQIKALAELDGLVLTWNGSDFFNGTYYSQDGSRRGGRISSLLYPTSYDAIIPCLTRLGLWSKFMQKFKDKPETPTPSEICRFVLEELGKWKE